MRQRASGSKSIYNLFNRSYRDYVQSGETLRMLNLIVLSAAVGTILFANMNGAAFAGYASALGAGEFAFGLIFALPVLAGLLQLLASHFIEKTGKCKRMFMIGGVIHRLTWFAVAFIPYFIPVTETRVWALVTLVTLASMGASFVGITHTNLMAEVVPMDIRGRYITTRQKICTLASLLAGLGAALLLDNMPGFLGYTIIFAAGGVAGFIDIMMYSNSDFPAVAKNSPDATLLKGMKECFTTPKTRNFLLFWILWSFSIQLCAPFGNKYAIDVLHLSFTYIIVFGQITANILAMLVLRRWGVFIDRYGSPPTLLLSTTVTALLAFIWLPATPGNVIPLFIINFIGGLFWCANDVCMVNMQFSHTPKIGRSVALAVFAIVTSISTAIALTIGGAALEALSPVMARLELTVFGTPFDHYKLIFCISGVLRLIVIVVFLPRVWNEKGMTLLEAYKNVFSDMYSQVVYVKTHLKILRRKS